MKGTQAQHSTLGRATYEPLNFRFDRDLGSARVTGANGQLTQVETERYVSVFRMQNESSFKMRDAASMPYV
jgi:hypothetical protein